MMRLIENKSWNKFADNLALPLLEGYSTLSGVGPTLNALKATALRKQIGLFVDELLTVSKPTISALDKDAIVGYRGSLATGVKFKTGGSFNPSEFDVDAFIVSDKLSKQFTLEQL